MGQLGGNIAQSVGSGGSVLGGIGNRIVGKLGESASPVKGTGQTVGELQKIGYSMPDIQSMGIGKNPYQRAFGAGMGALQGFGKNQQQPQQGGMSPQIQITQPQQVDPAYFQPQSRKFPNGQNPYSMFYGGGF